MVGTSFDDLNKRTAKVMLPKSALGYNNTH